MSFEEWQLQLEMELKAMDKVISLLIQLREATASQSYPGGLTSFGLRKRQSYEPGMEDCGK